MLRPTQRIRNGLKVDGRLETINSIAVTVIFRDSSDKILLCTGLTKPTDASNGYAKSCLFIDTDVATGTSGLYVNVGTNASCVFKLVTNAA